jgi:DNA-binding response OmpR family regulator
MRYHIGRRAACPAAGEDVGVRVARELGMSGRILLVDDEPRLLDGLRRNLRGRYVINTAGSGAEGLELARQSAQEGNPFAVIVSDMMMPGMSGAEFLTQARPILPDAVLMILSGQADLSSTISAVNNANLFRFLTKPIEPHDFMTALDAALRQHQLLTSERDLLQNTLTGAVDVLTDVLSMASPVASRRTERVRGVVRAAAEMLGVDDDWRLPIAAMLSHLGCIALPSHVLEQIEHGQDLEPAEREMWRNHPATARQLLSKIPRMEEIADWVAAQPTHQAAADAPGQAPADIAAAVLPAVAAFLVHHDAGLVGRDIARRLTDTDRYPETVVEAVLAAVAHQIPRGVVKELMVANLLPGMVVQDDVQTSTGLVLVRSGERVTDALIARLMNFAASVGVKEPLKVLVDA